MDTAAVVFPPQKAPGSDVSGCALTAVSVPNPSNRGFPSSLAGTTCRRDRSRISATAHRSTIRCRTDRSGPFSCCAAHPGSTRRSATIPPYSRPATTSHTWTPKTAQHAAICPTEPFPGIPIGDKGAFPSLTVSAPNSSQNDNSLQNRRERRPSRSRPDGRSGRRDRSTISLTPPQRASLLLAAMGLERGFTARSRRLAFLQLSPELGEPALISTCSLFV